MSPLCTTPLGTSVPVLSLEGVSLDFRHRQGRVKVLEDVSLAVGKGEILGIVGESGSGKSVLSYAVMSLLDAAAEITAGKIVFQGSDLVADPAYARSLRGREMSMIFQSPRTALNPIRKVGHQVEDVIMRHEGVSRTIARKRAREALERVHIADVERRYHAYPFELSGGLCQRVLIAMALACKPYLLIADEPTTGLDVTTQAVVMDLIRTLARDNGMAVLLITHDLAVAGEYCDRIAVMHAGHVVETAPAETILKAPRHPYTKLLVAATPTPTTRIDDLVGIPGQMPDLRGALLPCRFAGRCDRHAAACDQGPLPVDTLAPGHTVRCTVPL